MNDDDDDDDDDSMKDDAVGDAMDLIINDDDVRLMILYRSINHIQSVIN